MGFSRYWFITEDIPKREFNKFIKYAKIIIDININQGIKLKGRHNDDEPVITSEYITLNGVDEDGYETFVINRISSNNEWSSCKTQRKPYDKVVYELLFLAKYIFKDKYFKSMSGVGGNMYDTEYIKQIVDREENLKKLLK